MAAFNVPALLASLGQPTGPPDAAATRGPVHNLTHHLAGPLTLLAIGAALTRLAVLAAALDWTTHITFDRAAGHTLRNPDGSLR